jgi:uncharacterized repeat protein (TIGR01451 family)
MTRRCFVVAIAIVCGTVLATTAWGQSASKSLAERITSLRRGTSETEQSDSSTNSSDSTRQTPGRSLLPDWFSSGDEDQQQPATVEQRAGSAQSPTTRSATAQRPSNASLPGLGGSPLPQGKWTPRQGAAQRSDVAREISSDYPVIREAAPQQSTTMQRGPNPPRTADAGASSRHSPGLRPAPHINSEDLHRELAGSFSPGSDSPTARTARAQDALPADDEEPVDTPLVLPPIDSTPAVRTPPAPIVKKLEQPAPQVQDLPAATPVRSAAEAFGRTPPLRPSSTASDFARTPLLNTPAPPATTSRGQEAFGEALQVANGGDPSVLVSNQAPIITADIRGPKQIMIGREAVYRVRLQNQGGITAEGVTATVRIPSWADVVGTVATQGAVQPSQSADSPTQLEWQLARVEGRASETLDIRLVPRESRPLELGISWTVAPVGSRAIVEVQEPKIAIEVSGPNEVQFGKPQVFKLTLSNPGTGPAENVKIELVPPGSATEPAATHPLGTLAPGESKTVEIELTAREAGKLQIKAIASADGGLTTDMAKEIFCRKPELELDWRGPATQYSGTAATYFFRVRNPGTAPAEDVVVEVVLPEAAEFTTASEGQSFDPQRRLVTWQVGTLNPGDDNYMELKCVVKKPGANQFHVAAASAASELTDSAVAETNVIALADLKLEVTDPSGAVAVGEPAVYEVRIANRGASAARDVAVVALFSEGIEPDQAEGAMYSITDGRVAFQPIEELPAGREITLRIRAHALQPGTHVFRAEVLCSDAEIKLAAEETTRFYTDEVPEKASAEQQSATRTSFEATVR